MTEAEAIAKRIESFGAGRAFTAADFSDVAGRRNTANALGRLHARGGIARAIRGVYFVPERSALMGTEVPASADEVVRAIARANKWIVAPSGDAALNALGLDTQVSAKLVLRCMTRWTHPRLAGGQALKNPQKGACRQSLSRQRRMR